jgi:hypothetical protein
MTDWFGWSVAIANDTLAVGAPRTDVAGVSDAGAAFVYHRVGTTWSHLASEDLVAPERDLSDEFGQSVALAGDVHLVVGAHREDGSSSGVGGPFNDGRANAGGAYVFHRVHPGLAWAFLVYVKSDAPQAFDHFGISAAASTDTFVVGAYGDDNGADPGWAYVFR